MKNIKGRTGKEKTKTSKASASMETIPTPETPAQAPTQDTPSFFFNTGI